MLYSNIQAKVTIQEDKILKMEFGMSFLELTSCIKLQKSFNTACVCCSLENATKIFVWFLTGCLAQLPATLSVAN